MKQRFSSLYKTSHINEISQIYCYVRTRSGWVRLDWKEESYKVLHNKYKRARPNQKVAHSLSLLFYNIYNKKLSVKPSLQ